MKLGELIPDAALIQGAKAVFGPIGSHVLCFGSRGQLGSNAYYMKPRMAAQQAVARPWVICIGGGRQVRDNLGGHVLNVVRVGYDFGDTASFVEPSEAARLAQWPVAVVLNDVWTVDGLPHLVRDLGMPDRRVLENAMDGIIRHPDRIELLYQRIVDWEISQAAVDLPSNFLPASAPTLTTSDRLSALVSIASEEGRELWRLQREKESSSALRREAKRLNAERHGGKCTCEACDFASSDWAMLDAHHPIPLAVGVRITLAEHLVVLCPTCHRKAHRKNENPLDTYSIDELTRWNNGGRQEP